MRVIWVLENIEEDREFYSTFNTALLLASATLWKKNNPEDHCVLYCDKLTETVLGELNVLHLWDEIIEYVHSRDIDRSVFWAVSKVEVLSYQKEPVVLMDNDTLVFKPIKHLLTDNVVVSNLETGKGYYPVNLHKYVKKLSYRKRWKEDALNVSFLYFPSVDLIKQYTSLSLQMMEEFTEMNVPHSQYLIFAEQLLLRHLLDTQNINYRSLIKNNWDCNNLKWGTLHDKGEWEWPESELYFRHFGPLKSMIINGKSPTTYEEELEILLNCINIPNLDLTTLHKK